MLSAINKSQLVLARSRVVTVNTLVFSEARLTDLWFNVYFGSDCNVPLVKVLLFKSKRAPDNVVVFRQQETTLFCILK